MAERDFTALKIGDEKRRNIPMNRFLELYCYLYFQLWREPAAIRKFLTRELLPSIQEGGIRSMAQDSKILLASYEYKTKGLENIPLTGPLLVIANHWDRGPLNSYWPHFLINENIAENREEKSDISWVMQDALMTPGTRLRLPFTAGFQRLLGETYRNLLVPPPRIRETGHEVDPKTGLKIFRRFGRGELLGFYPEAKAGTNLRRGHYLAGELACGLLRVRPDSMVCPVGVWSEGRNGHEILHVNFDKAFPLSDILIFGAKPEDPDLKKVLYGNIANYLVATISPLMPERYRRT